jgi:hypothetical protein
MADLEYEARFERESARDRELEEQARIEQNDYRASRALWIRKPVDEAVILNANQRMRLNQANPPSSVWEVLGMFMSILVSAVGVALLIHWMTTDTVALYMHQPDTSVQTGVVFPIVLISLCLLNSPLVSMLPGFVQYLVCSVGAGILYHMGEGKLDGPFLTAFAGLAIGLLVFCWLRVNIWFLWQNSSNRTTFEKVAATIFYTTIFPFGIGMGFARLCGVGVERTRTQFVENDSGEVLETIPDNFALQQHKLMMETRRKPTPPPPAREMGSGDL